MLKLIFDEMSTVLLISYLRFYNVNLTTPTRLLLPVSKTKASILEFYFRFRSCGQWHAFALTYNLCLY